MCPYPGQQRNHTGNGRVEIRPVGNTAQAFYNFQSATTYDLTESEFRIELRCSA